MVISTYILCFLDGVEFKRFSMSLSENNFLLDVFLTASSLDTTGMFSLSLLSSERIPEDLLGLNCPEGATIGAIGRGTDLFVVGGISDFFDR